ncbi:YIP1 family protein [Halarchaeum sp. CBA1220]|uniref:Yip1 family protein n=1 Tax=Halarchaeum sp. CBA1220 TaxID=1853682 RepID=UPI0013140446|nr:Yip1 family protein [Halarchaeum sp. CBA1220]QLC33442.1 YIP1 family protein [Halarchaeum sp. CBA1220]
MFRLVLDPDAFFRDGAADRLAGASAVVGAAGVANTLGAVLLLYWTWGAVSRAAPLVTMTYVLTIAGTVLGQFAVWVGFAAAFYALSALLGGGGSFRRLFTAVGWGFYPSIAGGLLSAGAILSRGWGVDFPDSAGSLGPFVRSLTSGPLFDVVSLVGVVLLLWNASNWVFAVKHTRDLPLARSLAVVSVPIAVAVAWRLLSL